MHSEAKVRKSNAGCAMNGRYLLDSNILIDLLEGIEIILMLRNIADSELYISVITSVLTVL